VHLLLVVVSPTPLRIDYVVIPVARYGDFLTETQRQRSFMPRKFSGMTFSVSRYGFIQRYDSKITMYHYRGSCKTVDTSAHTSSFLVETWFGLDAADFRVACVHGFKIEVSELEEPNLPCVRFP
jgi:hypothetical protein